MDMVGNLDLENYDIITATVLIFIINHTHVLVDQDNRINMINRIN